MQEEMENRVRGIERKFEANRKDNYNIIADVKTKIDKIQNFIYSDYQRLKRQALEN